MHVLANVYQWELQYDCGVKHSPTGFLPNWEVITPIFAVEDGEKKDVPLSVVMRHEIDGTAEFVVATRGTRTTFEWRMALTPHLIFETAGAPGGFHSGVGNFALPLLAALQVLIDSEPLPIRRIIFAGHSLGGAVSAVAAALLDPRGAEVHAVTFGGPRVGDDKFYAALRRTVNVRSVEAAGDPIPRLPCGAMPACPAADSDILAFRASYFFGDPVGVVRIEKDDLPAVYRTKFSNLEVGAWHQCAYWCWAVTHFAPNDPHPLCDSNHDGFPVACPLFHHHT
eukprot:Polyplicarium_translucidae@DN2681_c0_g1_i1.p1